MLKFWDPDIIVAIAENTPHIIEMGHECNCEYCTCNDVEWYKCSECNTQKYTIKEFWKKWNYVCPGCGEQLMSQSEYNDYVWSKKRFVITLK